MATVRNIRFLVVGLSLSLVALAQHPGPIGGASQSAGQVGGSGAREPEPLIVTGVWTAAHSPYVLHQDVHVVNLTIEPGVEVVADPGVEIVVLGKLVAQGESDATIHFHNASAQGRWDGLRFQQASGNSALVWCRIDGSQSSGVEIVDSTVSLQDCEISDNESATYGGGISAGIATGDLVLERCVLFANSAAWGGAGIDAQLPNGQLVLDGCQVSGNLANPDGETAFVQGGGVRCSDSLALYVTGSTIEDNLVRAHSGYGSRAEGGGIWVQDTPLAIELSVVESNALDSWCDGGYCDAGAYGGGLYVKDSTTSMTLTIVRENRVETNVVPFSGFNKESCGSSGGGIFVDNDGVIFEASNCAFAGNEVKSTCKWNGSYAGGLYFAGNGPGSDLFLTNCVVARNRSVDGGWYAGGGGPILPGVVVQYGSPGGYQGGDGRIQNTIATENVGCRLTWGDPNSPCFVDPQQALVLYPPAIQPVNYSIFENSTVGGVGNLVVEPQFVGLGTTVHDLGLASTSPAIDAGNPNPAYEDVSFPPSQGTARNDMGIDGGPLAGGWSMLPTTP